MSPFRSPVRRPARTGDRGRAVALRDPLRLALACMLCVGLPGPAAAFCIYNYGEETVQADQVAGHSSDTVRFQRSIRPGYSACCRWDNAFCNATGARDAEVAMRISRGAAGPGDVCEVTIAADGFVEIEAPSDGLLRCIGH